MTPFLQLAPSRFQDDLRGLIEGDVHCDAVARQIYASDAGPVECQPYAIVFPRSTRDIVAILNYTQEHKLTIHPRGAGTGRTGGALGRGVILDMTRYMRRILYTTEETAILQPGAILERVNTMLAKSQGRMIGPDPGFFQTSSIGSLIATNGAGLHWLKYGFPHQAVKKLRLVLANGETVTLTSPQNRKNESQTPSFLKLEQDIQNLISPDLSFQADTSVPDRAGYRLEGLLQENGLDLIPLLSGSEGTLGIITEVELQTVKIPKSRGMAMFLFSSLDKAMRAVPVILAHNPDCCELVDRRRLNLLQEWDKHRHDFISPQTEAILVIEMSGDDDLILCDRIHDLIDEVWHREQLCLFSQVAMHTQEIYRFQQFLINSKLALSRMPHYFNGVSLLEDTAVPVKNLPSYLAAVQNLFKKHELTPSFSGHVGQGQLSVQPVTDLSAKDVIAKIDLLMPEFYNELFAQNGTVSSEQGCGLIRSRWISRQKPEQFPIFEAVKKMFDPEGILNPGKIIPDETVNHWNWKRPLVSESQLRPKDESPARKQMELQLKWNPRPLEETVFRCNGCGFCRTRSGAYRMCPVFRHELNEQSTPRAKASLFRGVIDETVPLETLTTDDSQQLADFCLHCHLCHVECPAKVEVSRLAFRSKSAYAAAHNLSLADRFFSHIDQILYYVAWMSCPINWTMKNRLMRWIYEKAFDLSQNRKLPHLSKISFLSRTAWYKRLSRPTRRRDKKVALFVDTFANHFDPKLADAAINVLEHNGIDVFVPVNQLASGVCAMTAGHWDRAEKLARRNTAILADVVRQGYEIITLEPTSALTLSKEYRYLVDDPEVELVASHTTDICLYLYQLHVEGKLQLDFTPIHTTVGYHAPCRSLALDPQPLTVPTAAESLLKLIPGLAVKRLECGCCGLSWDYGLRKTNARMSLRIGLPLFTALRNPSIQIGVTECNSCRMQMEQGTGKNSVHPLKLLAFAYNLMPEFGGLISVQPKK